MEEPCETRNNGEAFQLSRYRNYNQHNSITSSPWLDLRVFYVRISNFTVEDSTPEVLTINHIPLDPDTLLEINGVRMSMYSEGCSSQLRRDRVDKTCEEATYVSTDNIRLNGSIKFEVYDKNELVLSGTLEMSDGNGFTGESKSQWNMTCEVEITAGSGFLKEKSKNSQELLPILPTIEVYVTGCFSGTPIILTKTLQLGSRKKHNRRMTLDSIREYETAELQKNTSSELHFQETEYANYKEGCDGDMYWKSDQCLDGEMSWFNAGVRVGVGIGLGVCVGLGIGVGLLSVCLPSKISNIMRCYNNYSSLVLLPLLLVMLILDSKVVSLSSSCQTKCGNIKIQFPFGIEKGCYLDDWYQIECRNATFPFLFKMDMEVVNISVPGDEGDGNDYYSSLSFGSIRVKTPITSVGCSRNGQESGRVLNLTDSPFFFGRGNSLVAVGCNSKASLTNSEANKLDCEVNCTVTLPTKGVPFLDNTGCSSCAANNKGEEERSCNGNGCCRARLPDDAEAQQVIGVRIESLDNVNSTSGGCRVAFLTDEVYTSSNATEPQSFFAKGYTTVTIRWVVKTTNLSFLSSFTCMNSEEFSRSTYVTGTSCVCSNITISATIYANCACNQGYTGNPYLSNGCQG
ncbi:hypothetical protein Bca101_054972 [Brassica carinata]